MLNIDDMIADMVINKKLKPKGNLNICQWLKN